MEKMVSITSAHLKGFHNQDGVDVPSEDCGMELGSGDWKEGHRDLGSIKGGTWYHLKLFQYAMLSWKI